MATEPASPLAGKHVVLGVCGGIAAYKAVELCRRITEHGAGVSVVMTENATRFVGTATFAALTTEPVRTSLWDSPEPSPHTTLGQSADVIVVAPATARLIGEYATGISSDLLTSTLLASRAPVVIAPAMHTEMWEQPAVEHNIATLRARGVAIVDPEWGPLAGGDSGVGRLADISSIFDAVTAAFRPTDLTGLTVLITAGERVEPIDPVRFIGNRSSGKQGIALAEEAAARGAFVMLITTTDTTVSNAIKHVERVETASQMHDAVLANLSSADVVIMAAAVADFRPSRPAPEKLKKTDGLPDIALEPTQDILQAIARNRRDAQTIVGFAAETGDLVANAKAKLAAKNLDLIVANDVLEAGAGFGYDTNRVVIVDKNGRESTTTVVTKRTVAANVWDAVVRWRSELST